MSCPRRTVGSSATRLPHIAMVAVLTVLFLGPPAARGADSDGVKLVVVLYPENNDGSPGNYQVDQAIRATFESTSTTAVSIYNEYLDGTSRQGSINRELQVGYLREKYASRRVDLVIAGLTSALDFALKHRDIFPGAPIVFCAVDQREINARELPADVTGHPIHFDLQETLDLALRLHPDTQRVAVIAGSGPMDLAWEQEARTVFQPYEKRLQFNYLTGLAMDELQQKVAELPARSIVYYIHVFRDGDGKTLFPAHALEIVARQANAPIYGHVNTYVGRGIVGGRVFNFENEGRNAATLGLRILAGEDPQQIGIQPVSGNTYMFDANQLTRWNICEADLPPGSVVQFRTPGVWDLYQWQIVAVASFILVQMLFIFVLLLQKAHLQRAEQRFRKTVDAAPNGMLMVNRAGTIVLANPLIESLFGFAMAELIGRPVHALLPELLREDEAGHRDSFFAVLEDQLLESGRELSARRKDGSTFPVEIKRSPVEMDSGQFVLASVIDMTERRQAEDNLRTSQRQLRQLSASLIDAQENERRRVARELHDDFSQRLALLAVEVDLLRRKPSETVSGLSPQLDSLSGHARELSSLIHELSHELHPLKLEQLGLTAALRSLCAEMSESHDLGIDFAAAPPPDTLPAETSLCLFRIAQEALRNVVKHSSAIQACVTLAGGTDEIQLEIVDSGVGFDEALLNGKGGLGFISMRERLRLVGGDLTIESGPNCGTRVSVRVPADSVKTSEELSSRPETEFYLRGIPVH